MIEWCTKNYDEISTQINDLVSEKIENRDDILSVYAERETLVSTAEYSNTAQQAKIDEIVRCFQTNFNR